MQSLDKQSGALFSFRGIYHQEGEGGLGEWGTVNRVDHKSTRLPSSSKSLFTPHSSRRAFLECEHDLRVCLCVSVCVCLSLYVYVSLCVSLSV